MISFITTPAFLLLAGTFCYAGMGAVLLRHRNAPGANVTAFVLGTCLVWVGGSFVGSLVTSANAHLLAVNVSYIGACAAPVAILLFVGFYTRARPIERRTAQLLLLLPALSLLLVWTNPLHELMWAHPTLDPNGATTAQADWGPWFHWVHLPYMWSLMLVAAAYLLRVVVSRGVLAKGMGPRITRGQAAVLLVALMTTFAVNIYALLSPDPWTSLRAGPTASALALASFCFLWLFTQVELVPLRHVAHRRILNTMPDPVLVLDEDDRVLDLNPQAASLTDDPAPGGRSVHAMFASEPALLALLAREGEVLAEVRLQSGLSYEVRISPFHDTTGARRGRALVLRDVTERDLHDRRMRSIVDVSPNGIVRLHADIDESGQVLDAICVFANASAATYLGVEHATMAGARMMPALPAVGPQMLGIFQRAVDEGRDQNVDVPVAGDNQDPLWFRVIVSPVEEELMITFMEVTTEKRREAEMREVAYQDPLTHALNRRGLERAFRALPVQDRRGHGSHAVLFMDLDRFKDVNDTHGHDAGDKLLKEFAARLTSAIRDTDILARVGGDEFVVILVDSDPDLTTITVERLVQVSDAPYWLNEQAVSCSPSVGIAHVAGAEQSFAEAIIEADQAMYKTKAARREVWRLERQGLAAS